MKKLILSFALCMGGLRAMDAPGLESKPRDRIEVFLGTIKNNTDEHLIVSLNQMKAREPNKEEEIDPGQTKELKWLLKAKKMLSQEDYWSASIEIKKRNKTPEGYVFQVFPGVRIKDTNKLEISTRTFLGGSGSELMSKGDLFEEFIIQPTENVDLLFTITVNSADLKDTVYSIDMLHSAATLKEQLINFQVNKFLNELEELKKQKKQIPVELYEEIKMKLKRQIQDW